MAYRIKQNVLIDNRYLIQENLGEGGMAVVYKARDQKNSMDIAVKFLKPTITSSYVEDVIRFRKEVETVSKFDHPHIIKFYGSGEHQGVPYLITELLEGKSLASLFEEGKSFSIDEGIELVRQIAGALSYVHNRDIIHRDIKPGNIFIIREEKADAPTLSIKLLDFGLAQMLDLTKIKKEEREISGTFGYMSPEATGIIQKPIDERSDLYSLGVIFYELVTGRRPYQSLTIGKLLHEMVATRAVPVRKINPALPVIIEEMIDKLLDKEQEGRYQSAKGFLYDIDRYLKGEREFSVGERDQKIKLIYQTRLIGRDEEFIQIKALINKTRIKEGSICLIGGEPGVGKTRMVKAVKEYYLQEEEKGGFFIEGRCVSQENKIPYQPFKNALDEYIRKVENLKEAAREKEISRVKELAGDLGAILIKLNPNIKRLLGDVPELAALEPERENLRFLITAANFICNLAEEQTLGIMFLDDLQWADEGSLSLLEQISGKVGKSKLLIIGTYRDNEINEKHSLFKIRKESIERGDSIAEIKMVPLTLEKTNRLVCGILGTKEELVTSLSKYIVEKSRGNPFFTITLLKELVDQKIVVWKETQWHIDWERIKNLKIPGNIIDMVLLRLKNIPSEMDHLLKVGTIIGKEFELELLYELIEERKELIVDYIDKAVALQLLEYSTVARDRVLFVHDRIKEAFFVNLAEEERKRYHLKVAKLLEARSYGREEEILFELAHHYIEGDDEEKGLKHSLLAAEKAKAKFANKEAIKYYIYARNVFIKRGEEKSDRYTRILENLGEAYRLAGRFDDSLEALKACELLIPGENQLAKVAVLHKLADTFWDKGEMEECIESVEKALKILRIKIPKSRIGVIWGIIKQSFIQFLHSCFSVLFVKNKPCLDSSTKELIIVRLFNRLGRIYYFSDMNKAFYIFLRFLNISERQGYCSELAYSYISGIGVWPTFPWFSRAFRDGYKGIKISQAIGDKIREGCGYSYLTYCSFLANKPKEGLEYARKGISLLKSLGEYWDLGIAYCFRDYNNRISGNISKGIYENEEFITIAKESKALQLLGWALYNKGFLSCYKGYVSEDTIKDIEESHRLMKLTRDKGNTVFSLSILAYAYLVNEDISNSIIYIEKAAELFPTHHNKGPWLLEHFPIGAQIYLKALKVQPDLPQEQRRCYLRRIKWFCRRSYYWAGKYNYLLGWAYQVNGTYNWLAGKRKKAVKTWEKGIKFLRERNHDKYRLAYMLMEESSFILEDEKNNSFRQKADTYLREAGDIFKEIGANLDYQRVLKLLGEKWEETTQESSLTKQARLASDRRIDTILTTSRYLSSILDLQELLEKIIDKVIEVTGAERGILMLYPEDKEGGLEIMVMRNLEKEEIEKEGFVTSHSIIKKVEGLKKAIIIEDAITHSELKEQMSVVRYGLRSVLCIPIESGGNLIGIIYLENRLVGGLFKQSDLLILELIASQAGISIKNARLYKQAIVDGLTSIYNRMFFDNYLLKSVEQAMRYKKDLSLILIDVDNFKGFNDKYSHQAGDMVLKGIASEISGRIRRSDVAARYGGDEFVIILPETGLEGAKIVGESINKMVKEHRFLYENSRGEKVDLAVTVSVGITELKEGQDRIKLIENVDKALYKVKESGRDNVVVWENN